MMSIDPLLAFASRIDDLKFFIRPILEARKVLVRQGTNLATQSKGRRLFLVSAYLDRIVTEIIVDGVITS